MKIIIKYEKYDTGCELEMVYTDISGYIRNIFIDNPELNKKIISFNRNLFDDHNNTNVYFLEGTLYL